jgi:hypothetical protein
VTTLLAARTALRSRLDEVSAVQWTDAQLNLWLNEGAKDLARRTETIMTVAVVNVTSGLNTVAAPTDVLRLYRVEYHRTGDNSVKALDYYDINNMDEIWWQSQESAVGEPWAYTTKGYPPSLTIQLYPTPSDAATLRVHYYQVPATASADGSTLPIAAGWEDLVFDYAEMRAFRTDGDARWQTAFQIYEANANRMLEQTRRWVENVGGIQQSGAGMLPSWLVG